MQPQRAAARHFQSCQQGAGQCRPPFHRIAQRFGQEALQRAPIRQGADQMAQPLQRVLHGPQRQRAGAVDAVGAGAAQGRQVAAHQRGQIDNEAGAVDLGEILRRAAREHVLAELIAGAEPGGGGAHRLKVPQAGGEGLGGDFAFVGAASARRQQQAGFQPGEPCRHHQPVSREFQPHPARALDHREKLVHHRENRDPGQIQLLLARRGTGQGVGTVGGVYLLAAGQIQQQIERPFEAFQPQQQTVRRSLPGGGARSDGGGRRFRCGGHRCWPDHGRRARKSVAWPRGWRFPGHHRPD